MNTKKIKIGIVGACRRGGSFKAGCDAVDIKIQAVCDINAEGLDEAAKRLDAEEQYADYETMLEKSEIDAVIIGTPMHLHVPQATMALARDIHVLSEVPAAVSIDECKTLVQACSKSKGLYMMAENYAYLKPNMLIKELVRQGLFGEVYYAEGEYLHDLKDLDEKTKWRRHWQNGIDGITYGTHSLGPILQWIPGDRVVKVCCEGSGKHYCDPRGDKYAQDTSVMLCKTAGGVLIKIRVDMISDRPHACTNYQLQGTCGAYESSRNGPVDKAKIWLKELSRKIKWHDLDAIMEVEALAEKYLPEIWRNPTEKASQAGHGGGDYFEILDFVNAIRGTLPAPIGIHEAMDMTLPGLVSQQSICEDGRWLDVPNSREW